jgi:hypothetical protein
MQNGDVGQTIRNDAKSLELNPEDSNAIERLNKLQEGKNSVSWCWAREPIIERVYIPDLVVLFPVARQ